MKNYIISLLVILALFLLVYNLSSFVEPEIKDVKKVITEEQIFDK
jgi:hypothetical protein